MRIIFMGTPTFAVPALKALVAHGQEVVLCVSQPDKPQGRKQILMPTPVHQAAEDLGIPCFQPRRVRDQAFYDRLASCHPDLIVTAAYGRILTPEVLRLPRLGCINVHASLLPRYRGASPVQWALINGDQETGVTLLRMTEGMDEGPILAQVVHPLAHRPTADRLMAELADLGAKLLVDTLPAVEAGTLSEIPQPSEGVVYVSLLDRETGQMDFSQSATALEALVRGCTPWPTAYTTYQSKRFKVHQAHCVEATDWPPFDPQIPVGARLPSPKGQLWIRCGEGILALDAYQLEGGRRQEARETAHQFPIGAQFGEGAS